MLKSDKITINVSYRNITHYKKLGYEAYLHKALAIKTIDLPSVSHTKVDVICSMCDSENNIQYNKYLTNVSRHGFYGCRVCSREKMRMTYLQKGSCGDYIDKDRDFFKKAISNKNSVEVTKSEDNYKKLVYDESYHLYRNEVRRLTRKSSQLLLENWDGYDYYDNEYIRDNFKLSHIHNDYPSIDQIGRAHV